MKVEPQIADLEGYQFCNPEAAYCCEGNHEAVAVVSDAVRSHAKHCCNQDAVYRKQEDRGFPNEGSEASGPGRELPEARYRGEEPSGPVPILDSRPDARDG